jgi:hypothetical protein
MVERILRVSNHEATLPAVVETIDSRRQVEL